MAHYGTMITILTHACNPTFRIMHLFHHDPERYGHTHTDLAWSFHPMINPTRAQSWDHWSIEAWTPSPMSRTKALRALPAPGMQTGGNEINGWRHMGYIIYRSIDSYIHTKNADNVFFSPIAIFPNMSRAKPSKLRLRGVAISPHMGTNRVEHCKNIRWWFWLWYYCLNEIHCLWV